MRALISVSDKTGAVDFARSLHELGWEIVSTGGTARAIGQAGISVTSVEDVTGFPEIMNGRVKTLHPLVHGGILADWDNPAHREAAERHGIEPFAIVAVNLYPFEQTIARPDATRTEKIENIDIGGPTMIRSAAKNFAHVAIVVNPADYAPVVEALREHGEVPLGLRRDLAARAFAHTAHYDSVIAGEMQAWLGRKLPETLNVSAPLALMPRYGENPHQVAALYESPGHKVIEALHGKQLSYNNLLDVDAALRLIDVFGDEAPTLAIIKHTNPCGIGTADTLLEAYDKAFATDPLSPFGGVVVVNRILDLATAERINEVFTEIVIAPEFADDALAKLRKKKNRRLVRFDREALSVLRARLRLVSCMGGWLAQGNDVRCDDDNAWRVVTKRQPTEGEWAALRFGWKSVAVLKSNAVCFVAADRTIGLGIGQTSRIDSTEIAVAKAHKFGLSIEGSVCASDGFFPFRDSVDAVADLGVTAVIQPGGSKGDEEVIAACDEHGIAMIFTGMRHFRH
ncbi:MAG: bifunctional phosphoribosylaminoimidazolecarboxamide formyltransferase/IMP cyclohydrolase [Candidatus Cloacimonetes bacterium]|nr:bifunctional phosphoribosylaminoimidazolecarboxamide formyltransferase/IMP cyclohydrolase [Candidatus Cloacimonadota bacterium]